MSEEAKESQEPKANETLPEVGDVSVPMWLVCAFIALLWAGMLFLDRRGGGFNVEVHKPYPSHDYVKSLSVTEPADIADGRAKYGVMCASCHAPTGMGGAQAPALAGSDWVLAASPDRMVRVIFNGLKGPITLNGEPFNANSALQMPSIGSDNSWTVEDVANLVNFLRTNGDWGNAAAKVKVEDIQDAYDAAVERGKAQWTESELSGFSLEP